MRDRGMAKLFSFSCISAGTTALPPPTDGQKQPKTPELADAPPPPPPKGEGEELESTKKRHNMIHKFMKSFSHLFSLSREDEEEEEEEEEEREMVIGFPTDVQHVAHIGWDGVTSTTTITNADAKKKSATSNSWAKGPELLSLDSLSLKQFQAAMATLQAASGDPPPPSPSSLPPPSRPSPPPLRHRSFGN